MGMLAVALSSMFACPLLPKRTFEYVFAQNGLPNDLACILHEHSGSVLMHPLFGQLIMLHMGGFDIENCTARELKEQISKRIVSPVLKNTLVREDQQRDLRKRLFHNRKESWFSELIDVLMIQGDSR